MQSAAIAAGFPAIGVVRLTAERPVQNRPMARQAAERVIQLAVEHPPRIGEMQSISQLMSQVLERHGLKGPAEPAQGSLPAKCCSASENSALNLLA